MKPTYFHFNEKLDENKKYFVVPCNSSFEDAYFNRITISKKRMKITDGPSLFIIQELKPRKRIWSNENIIIRTYEKIIVGTKDKTKHLDSGLIFQLNLISKI
jgi:hypothetical protein